MKWDAVSFACLTASAAASPQAPAAGGAPAGCSPSYPGEFQIVAEKTNAAAKRDVDEGYLAIRLENGVLTEQQQRTGYIADNYQFQFDGPPQASALTTSGFSACDDGNLALGSSKVFYQCRSGEFYNLYDRNWAPQCEPINIRIQGNGNPAPRSPTTGVQSLPATQPSAAVGQINDGQVQAPADGAAQGGAAPGAVSEIADGQIQAPGAAGTHPGAVTQIADGQIQVPQRRQISQIPDGQIQAPGAAPTGGARADVPPAGGAAPPAGGSPVDQIPDGQIQAPGDCTPPAGGAVPISQIADGQIQAPPVTGTPAPPPTQSSTVTVTSCPSSSPAPIPPPGPAPVPPPASPTAVPPPAPPVDTITETYCPPSQTPQPPPPVNNGTIPQPPPQQQPTPPQQQPTPPPVPGSGEKLVPGTMAALAIAAGGAFLYL